MLMAIALTKSLCRNLYMTESSQSLKQSYWHSLIQNSCGTTVQSLSEYSFILITKGGHGRPSSKGARHKFQLYFNFNVRSLSVLCSQLRVRSDGDGDGDDEFEYEHDDFNSNDVRSFILCTLAQSLCIK